MGYLISLGQMGATDSSLLLTKLDTGETYEAAVEGEPWRALSKIWWVFNSPRFSGLPIQIGYESPYFDEVSSLFHRTFPDDDDWGMCIGCARCLDE